MGLGLVQLEEALLFQAELMELRASRTRPVVGAVVEARMDKGQGAVATVLVKRGTLKVPPPLFLGLQGKSGEPCSQGGGGGTSIGMSYMHLEELMIGKQLNACQTLSKEPID